MRSPFPSGLHRSVRRRSRLGPVDSRSRTTLDPIRDEIFGPDRLPQHARALAARHEVDPRRRAGGSLLDRLAENERILREAYRSLITAVRRDEAVSPAAEWLLDNFHLVESQIREARESLPKSFQRQLPRLKGGEYDGRLRVYALAREYVAHTDSRFDPATLEAFVAAYQETAPLTMGELWAVPSTLRLALVENLRRLAQSIVESRNARIEADEVADALREAVETDPATSLAPLRPYDRLDVHRDRAFVVELVYRLRQDDPHGMPALKWLEDRMSGAGLISEELVRREHASQVAAQATVANIVTSLRMIAAFDWTEFFEDVSLVEKILRSDSARVYGRTDFATRDSYRHAVEELARGSGETEEEVARRAVTSAGGNEATDDEAPVDGATDERARYLGYHLVFDGRRAFEKALGYRQPLGKRLRRAFVAGAYPGYFGTLVLIVLLLVAFLLGYAWLAGVAGWKLALLGAAALVPASDLAIALLHQDVAVVVPPRRLPKLELAGGIPEELTTLVGVPVLLTGEAEIARQVEHLEERYLANPEGHLAYALLTDWTDADQETVPGDEGLLGAAAAALLELNERYGPRPDGRSRFLLLHRRRVWTEREGLWMGWDRKRGKLVELNRLLRGRTDTTYVLRDDGLTDVPPDARFVITLDADTRLPPGAARRLVGAAAHPLNRARFDEAKGRVTAGYGILQPRVTALIPGAGENSRYHVLYAGPTGIDPYSSASSDVYQDLFGEGTYVGKGIYDVDAFQASLEGRIPEGALLSHDHFEGAFARCGLVSDIEVFDDFPTSDEVNARRIHRWARGDWQLLPWVVGPVPRVEGRDVSAAPPFLARWKMFDNLRRTLVSPSSFILLLAGWLILPLSPALWAIFVVATIAVPVAVPLVGELLPQRRGIPLRSHIRSTLKEAGRSAERVALAVAFLPRRAWLMLHAIFRTLGRTYITGRNLLEWTPAAHAAQGLGGGIAGAFQRQAPPIVVASIVVVGLAVAVRPAAIVPALVLAAIWSASPLVSWWLSRPLPEGMPEILSADEALELRRTARESWRFFEEYVTAEENWLPPDNFQEDPEPRVAHRTSPTNIGLYLLSVVSARDLGWIGTREAADRIARTLETMDGLEHYDGHLLNWYDSRTLVPLEPRYVSCVDSGNLAGHLLTIAEACREYRTQSLPPAAAAEGITDAVRLAREAVGAGAGRFGGAVTTGSLETGLRRLEEGLAAPPEDADAWAARLRELAAEAEALEDAATAVADPPLAPGSAPVPRDAGRALQFWAGAVRRSILGHLRDLEMRDEERAELAWSLASIAARADTMARDMDFALLYDPARKLLSIGYRPEDGRLDESYYDLLASEARLASLVAVATGDITTEHWFHLGRGVTRVNHGAALVSWSGSMFEYLMPYLVMEAPPGTLLAQTRRLVVDRQVEYGKERGVPWGVSESAYSARDLELTYQYSYFGVPGLGLARGLSDELVVAPYATALAAMVSPKRAVRNLRRLAGMGARGDYGFYESIDFSPARLPAGEDHVVVRAHMAHHQGMTVTALANVLTDGLLRTRFHRVPMVRSVAMLLQERTPRALPTSRPRPEEVATVRHVRETIAPVARRFLTPHQSPPATHLLSNGRYSIMLTAAGGGYSRHGDLAVTRWRQDATRDNWGSFVYLRDVESGEAWSAGWQPTGREPDTYEVVYSEGRADFRRRDGAITTTMEILVSPETDGELRRITVKNLGSRPRDIEVTSYAEIALVPPAADIAHPAFQKLFVQTEMDHPSGVLLATRRRRSPEDPQVWASHVAAVEGESLGVLQHETDRARFLGRGRSVADPASVVEDRPLSRSTGPVLDPIFSLRRTVRVRPGRSASVTFTTLVAASRTEAVNRAEVYRDPSAFERAAGQAWTQAQVQLQHLGISPGEANLFQRLGSRLLFLDTELRASQDVLARNELGQSALWPFGISGDRPIVVVRIGLLRDRELVRQLVRAHEYWGWKGLDADLVILNERPVSYADELEEWIQHLVRVSHVAGIGGHRPHGDVYVLRLHDLRAEDRVLLQAAAHVVLRARDGSLSQQLETDEPEVHRRHRAKRPRRAVGRQAFRARPDLRHYNGLGGFSDEGREYVITLGEGQSTPAPWINVIANPRFGFQVSEAGSGFTWSVNSRENRLTPWSNDPVEDPPGEVFYLRDEETGDVWTPTPAPIRGTGEYRITHSQGWSKFEHESYGILMELTLFVPTDAPVKISRLRVRNVSGRARRLSVTGYAEWVLGVVREAAALHVRTELDPSTGALFARNDWNPEFAGRVAFADLAGQQTAWTADRTEFLGRNGRISHPSALQGGADLRGTAGAGFDPCAALRQWVQLAAGDEAEVVFLLGQGADADEARALVEHYREVDIDTELAAVRTQWDDVLGTVQVDLPDKSMEPMLNRWLLYQTLSCRVFARSAFYQSGGAYGFRDQLQDFMALVVSRRDLAREHLLRAASRQFPEGDVQHWWHPPSGRGVRTRISDDLIWLPFGVLHYLEVTGDTAVLGEPVPFLAGALLGEDEHERYFEPEGTDGSATLYEHCARALDARLATGVHGLPLMGTGDWNDGMDRVGRGGKGESVWMGWFLHMALTGFAPIAEARGDRRADVWRDHTKKLEVALETHGWDGNWYRRAYFDDGTPLGSAVNEECRIDSIAQSWAVLSGVADPARRTRAMQSMEQYLVRRGDALVLLFTPPFDDGELDPGYIREYLPGVRENGGQYTHAAIWSVLAFAEMGKGDEALELFSILNPVNQASTRAGVHRYKVEPYVSVADVYAEPPHTGRGGWSWYTGSAGWMYRAGIEWILGFRLRGDTLRMDPCVPRDWRGYRMSFRYHSTRYEIKVDNNAGGTCGVASCEVDGTPAAVDAEGARVPLVDDGGTHTVRVVLGGGTSRGAVASDAGRGNNSGDAPGES